MVVEVRSGDPVLAGLAANVGTPGAAPEDRAGVHSRAAPARRPREEDAGASAKAPMRSHHNLTDRHQTSRPRPSSKINPAPNQAPDRPDGSQAPEPTIADKRTIRSASANRSTTPSPRSAQAPAQDPANRILDGDRLAGIRPALDS
ncbi:hypothetical protein GALLR39Z86_13170 [Glycomyces algeriensis]|uniref:Uncharacterized protein n=1 Tax=Glycomyces algeriensis TaxID=256037 RepID=A0A9W6G6X7_9ACTN|nr:hypothetical protein GALLR39Z86_13170 [Glycomyces algeriensis]